MSIPLSEQSTEMKILEVLKLFEETFQGKDTKKIKEAKNKLNEIFKSIDESVEILFLILPNKIIGGKEISLNLVKSLVVYLKNLFLAYKNSESDKAFNYLLKIFDLIFNKSGNNPNLLDVSILSIFQAMISILLSNKNIVSTENNYIEQLFAILLNSIKNSPNEKFLSISRCVVLFSTSLLASKCSNNNNYENLINDFYIPIVNIVFSHVADFIIPKNNIYNNEYILILKLLLDGFYTILLRMKVFFPNDKRKEIAMKFFKDYGTYCLELIQLSPIFDENTKIKFGDPNPILVFNCDEKICHEINILKSKAIQFLSFITQISTLEDKITDEETKNVIPDKDLIDLVNKLIVLIIKSFEDILNNENKFNAVRKNKGEFSEDEDSYNSILFQICVFLTRCLIREPIKQQFSGHMRQFLLNILFPMIVTIDDESAFSEADPEGYHQYLNDIITEFKSKNFRTSACFLINKICERFENMSNFMLAFCLEMLNFILNAGQVSDELKDINIYLKHKDTLINKFNDKKKLDFALLLILILRDKLKSSPYLKDRLVDILINNTDKIHSILFPIIKIKLCKIYYYLIPNFFENDKKISEDTKKIFIENVVNYLLNNLIQKNLQQGEEYSQALSYAASDSIMELLNLPKDSEIPENAIMNLYVTKNLENNFGIINQLIENVDIYNFFLVVDYILGNIKINNRNLIFECINNLTKKFQSVFLSQNEENKLFLNQYFTIMSSFLTGVNRFPPNDKSEISLFNKNFDPILNYIKNPKKFDHYEHLVSTTEDYIKCIEGINEESALVLKSIKLIIDKDKLFSSVCCSFVSTFLNYIQKNLANEPLNQQELFNEILEMIKKGFAINVDSMKTSKTNALLLTFQILNLNPNLNTEIFEYLIINSLNSFELTEVNEAIPSVRDNINQISLANVSLGFIFRTDETFQILQKKYTVEINGQIKEYTKFVQFISYIKENLDISLIGSYCPTLGKCTILGICAIFSNKNCAEQLKKIMDIKIFLLTIFINIVIYHKKKKNLILNKLMKKETNCNFVNENGNDEDEEEEEEDFSEDDEEFDADIEKALKGNDNIKNSDEFKFFSDVMKNLKENDKEIYEFMIKRMNQGEKILDDLSKVRNIKIKYHDKEFTVPRKTVKIIRKTK